MMGSSAPGRVLKWPNRVQTTYGDGGSHAAVVSEGRSLLLIVSPFRSWPRMMLNGAADEKFIIGFRRMPNGAVKLPPIRKRCRTSNCARLHSFERSKLFAGNVVTPSVFECACPKL